jgi:YD repeat-containing protein
MGVENRPPETLNAALLTTPSARMLPIDWGSDGNGGGGDAAATRPASFRGTMPYRQAISAALRTTELGVQRQALEVAAILGSSSFGFEVPVTSYPGRGELGLSLKLLYNSRVWQRMSGLQTRMVFNIDGDWPAPGWRFNFPKMISHGNRQAILIDSDGTRHPYVSKQRTEGENGNFTIKDRTSDGSFIDYVHEESPIENYCLSGFAWYPGGKRVQFRAPSSDHRALYPTVIADRNGNFIRITYRGGTGPAIEMITDTCGRMIRFHYDSAGRLTTITGPGLEGAERELLRLHYVDEVELRFNFGANAYVQRPAAVTLIDGLMFPATSTGYWLQAPGDYSSYGMLRRVRQCRGMSLTSTSLNDQGTMSAGRESAVTQYDYPEGPGAALDDVPTFGTMTQSWERSGGEWADKEVTRYSLTRMDWGGLETTIVHPDGSSTVELKRLLGEGLVPWKLSVRGPGGEQLQGIITDWEIGHDSAPRVKTVSVTNGRNRTHITTFAYGAIANRLTDIYHRAFNSDFVIQRTHTEYVDASPYGVDGAHLLYLPSRVQVFDNGGNRCVACTEFEYDTAALRLTPGAVGLAPIQSSYRGNPTLVRRYVDAARHASPIDDTRRYDECGNLVSSDVGGHRAEYVFRVETQYCAPSETITGSPDPASPHRMRSSVLYNQVGLPQFLTDVNGLRSEIRYEPGSLRVNRLVSSTGASVTVTYDDQGMSQATRVFSGEQTPTLTGYSSEGFDGKGHLIYRQQVIGEQRQLTMVGYRFDGAGRLKAQSTPFTGGEDPAWATFGHDALGRLTWSVTPDGGVTRQSYDEPFTPDLIDIEPDGSTVRRVDPVGRQRWALYDPLGRLVQLVSADPDGDGALVGEECLLVQYDYDGNNKLASIRTRRGSDMDPEIQRRRFRYDSLGRLTHLDLPERGQGLNDEGAPADPDSANWSEVYTYDQRSNPTSRTDSRGIATRFDYAGDPLDRIKRISYDLSWFVDGGVSGAV